MMQKDVLSTNLTVEVTLPHTKQKFKKQNSYFADLGYMLMYS